MPSEHRIEAQVLTPEGEAVSAEGAPTFGFGIDTSPEFAQFNYSLAEREAERRLLPLARDEGVAVLVNRPLGQGQMFARVQGRPLPDWASEIDCASWAQLFLKFILGHPAVTCVIPGTRNPKHLADNLAAARGRIPDEPMRKRIAAYFDSL